MRILPYALITVLALAACDAAPLAEPPPALSCAAGSIRAQGSSAQAGALNAWIRGYQIGCPDATIAYDSVGSGAGVRAFLAGTGDFAGTDSALSNADRAKADARCRTGPVVHLPMVVGPIALAYNVSGVGDLRLRPGTIARIFSGAATRWNDAAIAGDNPGLVLPSTRIVPVHRSDNSGTTDNFTRFLAAAATSDWSYGNDSAWAAPGGVEAKGSNGVSAKVAETDGAIGYVEWSYARFHSLRTALVGNGAGEFVALTGEAAGRAVASARPAGSTGALAIDYRTSSPGAYPLVLVTYEVVCTRGSPGLVQSFLAYTASSAGQAAVVRLGYAPLPDEVRRRVEASVANLR